MKRFDTSSIPSFKVGGVEAPRVIVGCLPFLGESYQGESRNREYAERFSNSDNTVKVLVKIVKDYGITAVSVVPTIEGKLANLLLRAIEETKSITGVDVAVAPCLRIPLKIDDEPIDDYRRWISYLNYEVKIAGRDVLKRYLSDPILLCRKGWRQNFQLAALQSKEYSKDELNEMKIDFDRVKKCLECFQGFKVLFIEPGSESDFLTISGRVDLLDHLLTFLREHDFRSIVLGVHHAGSTIPILERSGISFDGYLTPVNRLGVMMFPSKDLALKAIRDATKPVIAMKTLAGGRIPIREGLDYVFGEVGVDACMIGVGSIEEADEDFSVAKEVIEKYF